MKIQSNGGTNQDDSMESRANRFFCSVAHQVMVHFWFGARWFGRIQTTKLFPWQTLTCWSLRNGLCLRLEPEGFVRFFVFRKDFFVIFWVALQKEICYGEDTAKKQKFDGEMWGLSQVLEI